MVWKASDTSWAGWGLKIPVSVQIIDLTCTLETLGYNLGLPPPLGRTSKKLCDFNGNCPWEFCKAVRSALFVLLGRQGKSCWSALSTPFGIFTYPSRKRFINNLHVWLFWAPSSSWMRFFKQFLKKEVQNSMMGLVALVWAWVPLAVKSLNKCFEIQIEVQDTK